MSVGAVAFLSAFVANVRPVGPEPVSAAPHGAVAPQFEFGFERPWEVEGLTAAPDGTTWLLEQTYASGTRERLVSVGLSGETQTFPLPRRWRGPRQIGRSTGATVAAPGVPDPVVDGSGGVWYLNRTAGTLGRIRGESQSELPLPIIAGDLALASNGRDIWVLGLTRIRPKGSLADDFAGVIIRVAPSGRVLTRRSVPVCRGIATGHDGRAWLACGETIRAVATTGAISVYRPPRGPMRKNCLDEGVWEIARGRENLWFSGSNGCAVRRGTFVGLISSKGRAKLFTRGLRPDRTPVGLAGGPDGHAWFGGIGPWIGHVNAAGAVKTYPLMMLRGVRGRASAGIYVAPADQAVLVLVRLPGQQPDRVYRMTL